MFKRRKNEDERAELDAAWDDVNPAPYFAGAAAENDMDAEDDVDADVTTEDDFSTSGEDGADVDVEVDVDVDVDAEDDAASVDGQDVLTAGRHGRHGSGRTSKQERLASMPEHQKRSRRMRRILILVALLLLALLAALGYFGFRLFQESREVAEQETTDVTTEVEVAAGTEELSADTGSASTKKTSVPALVDLLGMTQQEAIEALGAGATVTLDSEITDETSPMMHRLTVVLTEEPSDTKSGTPTVYLGLDTDEKVVIAGYSAATASLGYGTLSFADVVSNEHVVERTLSEGGLQVADGSVVLPDSSTYSTYQSDGVTLVKEQCTFDGETSQNGADYAWTSVLVYNYTAANATGNLADTVRQIYVYVSDKGAAAAALESKAAALKAAQEAKEAEEKAAKEAEEAEKKAAEEAAASSADTDAAASQENNNNEGQA